MFAAAGRRFAGLLLLASILTIAGSIFFGLLAGASMTRAISLGFYLIGSFLLVGGFFVGNRGPVRLKKEDAAGGMPILGLPLLGGRSMRWATPDEREEAISMSAVLVTLGLVLILIGVVVDSRVTLV
jgi:hypothetical protein